MERYQQYQTHGFPSSPQQPWIDGTHKYKLLTVTRKRGLKPDVADGNSFTQWRIKEGHAGCPGAFTVSPGLTDPFMGSQEPAGGHSKWQSGLEPPPPRGKYEAELGKNYKTMNMVGGENKKTER